MITDRTIVSGPAEKQNGLGRRLTRGIITASAVVAFNLPLAAWGLDSPRKAQTSGDTFEQIRLPPIPFVDTMPWFDWKASDTLKVDTLLSPYPDPWGLRLRPTERDTVNPAVV